MSHSSVFLWGLSLLLGLTLRLCWGISSVVLPSLHDGVQRQAWEQCEAEVQYPLLLGRHNWKEAKGQARRSIVPCFMHNITGCVPAHRLKIGPVIISPLIHRRTSNKHITNDDCFWFSQVGYFCFPLAYFLTSQRVKPTQNRIMSKRLP